MALLHSGIIIVYMIRSESYHKKRRKGGRSHFFKCRRNKENVPPDGYGAATHAPPDLLDATSDVLHLHHAPPDLPHLREALHPDIATGTLPVITNEAAVLLDLPLPNLPTTDYFLNLHGM